MKSKIGEAAIQRVWAVGTVLDCDDAVQLDEIRSDPTADIRLRVLAGTKLFMLHRARRQANGARWAVPADPETEDLLALAVLFCEPIENPRARKAA
jgi:hypothetical protein